MIVLASGIGNVPAAQIVSCRIHATGLKAYFNKAMTAAINMPAVNTVVISASMNITVSFPRPAR